jgi:2-methylcitrate dehydratase PrpD
LHDGRSHTERVAHATGSPDNPVTDAQLERKFRELAGSVLPKARVKRLLATLWRLEQVTDVGEIIKLCRIPSRRQQH